MVKFSWRDYKRMTSEGIKVIRKPQEKNDGIVAVFEDLYANQWD